MSVLGFVLSLLLFCFDCGFVLFYVNLLDFGIWRLVYRFVLLFGPLGFWLWLMWLVWSLLLCLCDFCYLVCLVICAIRLVCFGFVLLLWRFSGFVWLRLVLLVSCLVGFGFGGLFEFGGVVGCILVCPDLDLLFGVAVCAFWWYFAVD